jgi:zinc transport system ATP-binding protein
MDIKINEEQLQLKAENITIAYDRMNVVEDVSIFIESGDYLSIVGENGSGKSSLLKGILGLVPIKSGEVTFFNDVSKRNIGYLPQQMTTWKEFPASVYEVVLSGCLTRSSFHPFYTKEESSLRRQT